MLLTSYFLLNLFCGFFSCQYNYDRPLLGRSDRGVQRRRAAIIYPTVVTHSGAVEGFSVQTVREREVFAFEGIPYGEAPVGDLRFRTPKPKSKWEGIRQAKAPGSYCAQLNNQQIPPIMGKEDCLFLNIYTPELPDTLSTNLLPVIVYFHGGAYAIGGSHEIGPAYLLDHDIVLVTVNYRLGVLGFLSTQDEASPGNFGLKDQALALEWINKNIGAFGGNNSLVTLFGSSAGAASVHLHMLSKKTRKFFSAGISSSGNAYNPWAMQSPGEVNSINIKLAKMTKCSLADTKAFVNCLRKMNVFKLVGKQALLYEWYSLPAVLFGPVVEPPVPDAFLTESPREIYKRNATANYPWISTLMEDECEGIIMILDAFGQMNRVMKRWTNMSTLILDFKHKESDDRADEIATSVTKYYFGEGEPKPSSSQQVGQVWSDRYFNFPTHEAVIAHAKIAPTYTGVFGYRGKPSVAGYFHLDREKWGTAHGEDEFYYFNRSINFKAFKRTDPDYAIVKFLTSAITNFAKTREPFYMDETGSPIRVWEPVQSDKPVRSLYINNEIKMIDERHQNKFGFWESLQLK